jgi:hypothetical protein
MEMSLIMPGILRNILILNLLTIFFDCKDLKETASNRKRFNGSDRKVFRIKK